MVFDYISTEDGKIHRNKKLLTFSPEFLYLSIRNQFLGFFGSLLSLTISFVFGSDLSQIMYILAILYLTIPVFYFVFSISTNNSIYNVKTKYFLRLIYLLISSIIGYFFVTFFVYVFLIGEENAVSNNIYIISLIWAVLFLLYVGIGRTLGFSPSKRLIIQKLPHDDVESRNYQTQTPESLEMEKRLEKHSRELIIKELFNKKELTRTIIVFYLLLGGFILLIFSRAFVSDVYNFINYDLNPLYFLLMFLVVIASIIYAIVKTIMDSSENKLFLKDLLVYRLIFYLVISSFVIFVLLWIKVIMEAYYISTEPWYNFLHVDFMYRVIFVWILPWFGVLAYVYRRNQKTNEMETYEQLLSSQLAMNLSKYYLLTRLSEIKNVLDTTDPLDFDMKFKRTIERNVLRLKESCNSNGLKIKSDGGLKKYVLHVASPLRETLREAIGKNYTELYLSDTIPSEERVINYDEVWRKLNKAFLQWESNSPKD
ncbi:MAG: hypothetical protein ACW981_00110 [Candidatus Hodarchaeales archaeon]